MRAGAKNCKSVHTGQWTKSIAVYVCASGVYLYTYASVFHVYYTYTREFAAGRRFENPILNHVACARARIRSAAAARSPITFPYAGPREFSPDLSSPFRFSFIIKIYRRPAISYTHTRASPPRARNYRSTRAFFFLSPRWI